MADTTSSLSAFIEGAALPAVNYVVLNGKQYVVHETRYEPTLEKTQRVDVTVGGHHIAQQFNFIEWRWGLDLYVPWTGSGNWGSLQDIKDAYQLPSCLFKDHYGSTYRVFFEGPFVEKPKSPRIDGSATFTVPVTLRRKQ
jgi:hypothetical protein